MSSSYPKVHVVGSGAYYSYRPTNRFVDRGERNYIRDCSSRPKEFSQYMNATNSRGDGFKRPFSSSRGSSLPPFDNSREDKKGFTTDDDPFFKKTENEFFKKGGSSLFKKADDSFKRSEDDSFLNLKGLDTVPRRRVKESFYKRGDEENISKRKSAASYFSKTDDETILSQDKSALFSTGEDTLTRLRRKHPFRLPVENEVVAPHESSIWPENRAHFDLVSSYDVMVDYLGIRDKTKH